MNIMDLKDQIMHNTLSNFYIFTGYELGIMKIYLEQMSNKLGLPITRADSVAEVYGLCQGGTLFGESLGFYVIRDDHDFMKQEKVFDTIKSDIGKNTIVLLYDKIDSRLKFGKKFKDDIVVFEKLAPNVLKSYILREIPLSNENVEKLIEVCNGSYDMCMLEIDKIKQYTDSVFNYWTQDEPVAFDADTAFRELLESGVIYQPEESDVFKFTDALCSRDIKKALHLETVLRDNGVSTINLLGTLYNSMKSIMLIQCCNGSNIAEVTGLDNGQIYFNKKYKGKYTTPELVNAVKIISKVVSGIKSGWIEEQYATRFVIASII